MDGAKPLLIPDFNTGHVQPHVLRSNVRVEEPHNVVRTGFAWLTGATRPWWAVTYRSSSMSHGAFAWILESASKIGSVIIAARAM